ncbi:MAG: F0F1 ATP synthase subunit gamma [Candidatus Babeliaceae bacterium]|nr:F0F1 ATP synthase subunit gamma [Candidatus Babeliaceae bacterium]
MTQVTQLRQRIRAVELIQKTTHAMRLTSMSTHVRLHKKQAFMESYRHEIEETISNIKEGLPHFEEQEFDSEKELLVIVGSQKGLCGSFNTKLNRFFEQEYPDINPNTKIIVIGKRIIESIAAEYRLLYSFELFNPTNFFAISSELCQHLLKPHRYRQVTLISNIPITFFLQRPTKTTIIIPQPYKTDIDQFESFEEGATYLYDQNPFKILANLERLLARVRVEEILFKSLIAEQAARFISMDASTTNAEKMLSDMKRDYNKLRQATITRELMDLIGGQL